MVPGKTDALCLSSHIYSTFRHSLKSSCIPNVAVSIPLEIEKVCPPATTSTASIIVEVVSYARRRAPI
jgi:hypothetical protein